MDERSDPQEHRKEVFDRLEDAAIAAELETGKHEATREAAQRHVLHRLAIIVVGHVIVVAGLIMLLFPGPGLLAIAAGLGILSTEVAWADRALRALRAKVPGVPEEGPIPRSAIITAVVAAAAAALAGLWWFTR